MTIDLNKMHDLEKQKLISIQQHPSMPLLIFNYTQRCQFDKIWDENTSICRGLITNLRGDVVARPFPKFFNLGEHEGEESALPKINWKQDFTATKKADGSLGILYKTHRGYDLATRGSFTSDQAAKARVIFYAKGYDKYLYNLEDYTYLFEIIFPENRIVLDYGSMEDLILLDVIHTETGKSIPHQSLRNIAEAIGCPIVEYIQTDEIALKESSKKNVENEEGYVVRFDNGMRIKVKFEEYVRLHRLITGVNAKHIWESLMNGQSLDDLMNRVPDEFFQWVKNTKENLEDAYLGIERYCKHIIENGPKDATQKEWAFYFLQDEAKQFSGILFPMLKKQEYSKHIWKMIRPEASTPFKDDPDA